MPSTRSRHHPLWIAATVATAMIAVGHRTPAAQADKAAQAANPDAAAIAGFMERVNQYVAVHQKLKGTLPKLPQEATPEQIDQRERALGALIQSARKTARRGDLFTPEMTVVIKRLMTQVFSGPEGQLLRSSVMDENVKDLPLRVNQRFPDGIPMTTMPPAVLKALPDLPEQMQYRFVALQFVLLDPHANVVADFIPGVLPAK